MLSIPRLVSRDLNLRPLFRLLEEPFYNPSSSQSLFRSSFNLNSFNPSFDVKETKDSYVLDGELPGIVDKSNLDLSFVDPHTLVIRGKIEKNSETGRPDAATATPVNSPTTEGNTKATATEGSEDTKSTSSHQPTVEDEPEHESSVSATADSASTEGAAVTKTNANATVSENNSNNGRYWLKERYYGEFQRSFHFPQTVDHEAVKASLKNGILSVVVPKKEVGDAPRRINVE